MSRGQRGFTLLETLVAMTLMAMLLGALLPVFQGGLRSLGYGAGQTRAALLAEALLTEALVVQSGAEPVPPLNGSQDGMRWWIERKAYEETELPGAGDVSTSVNLWEISARVEWGDGRQVQLRGLAPSTLTPAAAAGAAAS